MPPRSLVMTTALDKEIEVHGGSHRSLPRGSGVELVGPLPPETQYYIQFVADVSAQSKLPAAARDLLSVSASPTSLPVARASRRGHRVKMLFAVQESEIGTRRT